MKTLVIHPKDKSTDFLAEIYRDKGYTVETNLENLTNRDYVRNLIDKHDRIMMMGHGSGLGLFNPNIDLWKSTGSGFIIDSSFAEQLRTKETITIWCYSDRFCSLNNISDGNIHTGMVISEVDEEHWILGHATLNEKQMDANMALYAATLRECVECPESESREYFYSHYVGEDDVTQFNRKTFKHV